MCTSVFSYTFLDKYTNVLVGLALLFSAASISSVHASEPSPITDQVSLDSSSVTENNPLVLLEGPYAKVTSADLEADAINVKEDVRRHAFSNPARVHQLAETLFIRKSMAEQARQAKLADTEVKKSLVTLAEDEAWAKLLLLQINLDSQLDPTVALQQARTIYNAEPDRFKAPAQTRARHLLLQGDTQEIRKEINTLYEQLIQGADFATLAKEKSQDPGSGSKGGDLGFFSKGKMAGEFEKELEDLKENGSISAPFKTRFGWHIVQLVERRDAGIVPFEEVSADLVEQAYATIAQGKRNKLIQTLKNDAIADQSAIEAFSKINAQ